MSDNQSNNKRIAKNTLMLYFRMFLTMGVALYTSRIVLQTLGASDYGIYNVVGGFVAMLAYLNSAFVGASQRFFSFSLGKGDAQDTKHTFGTSVICHICIGLLIVIVAETFGLWFINEKLNIEPSRMIAANWVFQSSVCTLLFTVFKIPFDSCVIAHERMSFYAYLSIVDVILKLLIVYCIVISPFDQLVTYALLLLIVGIVNFAASALYCLRNFSECKGKIQFNKGKFKEMTSFAGWVLIGNLGFSFKDQLSNILFNLFLGTTVNAARGLAAQVNAQVTTFANNFFMAMAPQITKQYAMGNIDESKKLVYAGARFTFMMMTLVTVPLIMNLSVLLDLWLVSVPRFTYEFLVITLSASLISTLTQSTVTAIQATSKMKYFQIGISMIMLFEIPCAYIVLRLGYPAPVALAPSILTSILGVVFRFSILRHYVSEYRFREFLSKVVNKAFWVSMFSFISCFFIHNIIESNQALYVLIEVLVDAALTLFIILLIGLTNQERNFLFNYIIRYIVNSKQENKIQ